jgi:hypothetical protein
VLGEQRHVALEDLDVLLGEFAGALGREPVPEHTLHLFHVAVSGARRGVQEGRPWAHRIWALHWKFALV